MGKSSRGKKDVVAARLAKQQQRQEAFDASPVQEAHRILADFERTDFSYRLSYYALEPEQLGDDLDVTIDGQVHRHRDVLGETLHLDEAKRRDSVTEASRDFTGPFIAVIRRPEDEAAPAGHATIVQGVNIASEMLRYPLEIMMRARRIERLPFAGLIGLSTTGGEWSSSGPDEIQQIIADFQTRVEAEAVIAAGEVMADLHR